MTNNIALPHHAIASRVSDEIMQQTKKSGEAIVAIFKMHRVDLWRARERLFSEIIAIDIRSSQRETRFGF